jgi:uncharacterized surface protein with fasciclin (FAS1) repeats
MYKFLKNLLCLLLVVFAFSACRKKALDDFYGRPATLADPIYQTLKAKGNFVNFLACIDRAGYNSTLSTAGYWTCFAPNDDAFKKYFTANGITSVSQISDATAKAIVTYSLVFSGYVSLANGNISGATLDVMQPISQLSNGVFVAQGPAFKRKTAYHDGVYQDTVPNFSNFGSLAGQKVNLVTQDRNFGYDYKDFNNKYIPYFTPYYFNAMGLTAYDYNYFYPTSTFTNDEAKFNVLDGNVVNANVICENGVLQEINTVPVPLPSLEKYLYTNSNYSHFYRFVQQYGGLTTYVVDNNATQLNQVATGQAASVYCKQYSFLLAFSFPNENYLSSGGGSIDPQGNGWTMFAPNNGAFDDYVKTVLLAHYTSVAQLPQNIITDFINAHLAQQTIWPSKFNLSTNLNYNRENMRIDPNADVVDRVMCSNGLFYGSNKVQPTNNFTTVFGKPYLDPAYSIMTRMLTYGNYKIVLASPLFKFTMVMLPDATLAKLGYAINPALLAASTAQTAVTLNGSTSPTIDANLFRIINLGIYRTPNNELNNLNGTGLYATAGLSGASEVVKFTSNQLIAAGNQDLGTSVVLDPNFVTTSNGTVYYPANTASGITLVNTPVINSVGQDIFNKGQVAPVGGIGGDPYYMFYKYLSNSTLWTAATKAILGIDVGTDYTIFIPTNAAMQDAVNNGWLPGTGTGAVKVANFTPSAAVDVAMVANFIKYHIIKANQVIPDGKKNGAYLNELFNSDGSTVSLTISNTTATLAERTVIQSIDTYLQYYDFTSVSSANPNPIKY